MARSFVPVGCNKIYASGVVHCKCSLCLGVETASIIVNKFGGNLAATNFHYSGLLCVSTVTNTYCGLSKVCCLCF